MTDKPYRIRRALVTALYDYSGAQDLATLLCAPAAALEAPAPDEAHAAWQALIDAGIVLTLAGYDNQVGKLASHIRAKMEAQQGALPRIVELWGRAVL